MLENRLRELLEESGLTLRDIAPKLGVKFTTVSEWQNGKSIPRADSILKLCEYFNCSADYLLGLSDSRTINPDAVKAAAEVGKLRAKVEHLQAVIRKAKEVMNDDV